jgi:aerobic carbon-monoxide dehydrogenase large subunit
LPLGAWTPYSAAAPARNVLKIPPGPYAIPDLRVAVRGRMGATAPVGIYRGAGRPEAAMLIERLVDEAARQLGRDPFDMRRANLGFTHDTADLAGLLDTLEAESKPLYAARDRARAQGRLAGVGIALYVEPCGEGWESAAISQAPDGRVRVAIGSTAQGQGRATAAAQIAAHALGRPIEAIEIVHGDTDATQEGIGALASRSTPIGGSAILEAAKRFLDAPRGFNGVIEVRHEAPGEAWASGALAALVEIDRDTGHTRAGEIVWIDDAGTIVNPALLEGQLLGGLAQGLGEALLERVVHDENGQVLTGSLMDYAVPRAADMPVVRIVKRPTRSRANALGAKGAGEAGTIGVPAALANAVRDALAPETMLQPDMPFTPARVWRALHGESG